MIESTAAYKAAVTGSGRRVLLKAVINIIDPDIVYGAAQSSGESLYSKPEQLHNKVFVNPTKYGTLEKDRWRLDGSWSIAPDDPAELSGEVAFQSETLCGGDGVFSPAQWVELRFSGVSILQSCSVWFPDNDYDGRPEDFTVEVRQGGTAYFSKQFTGNTQASVSLSGFTVYDPDAIRVTVTRWSVPHRRLRCVEIVPGTYEEWDNGMIAAFDVKHQGDFSCVSLPYGTCTLKMDNLDRRFEPRSKNGLFQSIEERQGIDLSIGVQLEDGSVEYKRAGVFYQASGGWTTGDNGISMQWDLVDIIGLLADREFIPPGSGALPVTLSGWLAALAAQLGVNFESCYTVDQDYAEAPVTANSAEDVAGKTCGDILRWVCMAAGVWPRADAETGHLAAEPLWSQGGKIDLDNLAAYPVLKANDDLAAILFTLADGAGTKYVVSGNATASGNTVSVNNPFIHTAEQALAAAQLILSCYGGNRLELTGRGDPSAEIGDVDTVWLDESSAVTARRLAQTFGFSGGVLQNCKSTLLQADGSFLYQNRVEIRQSGDWTCPAGVRQIRVILVGGGAGGEDGGDGTWQAAGQNGADGAGGKVWAGTINVNEQQVFSVAIGQGGSAGQSGGDTAFGAYSSAAGERFAPSFTDVASGEAFGRSGVSLPLDGTGDGGAGGRGGVKGERREEQRTDSEGNPFWKTVVDNEPGEGMPGTPGAAGCVIVYYDKA